MRNHITTLLFSVTLLLANCSGPQPADTAKNGAPDSQTAAIASSTDPNVVLIILDTLRADVMGAYGAKHDASREFDAFAAQGIRFESVVAPSSWTRPSIGAIVTGVHPRRLGIFHERNEVLPDSAQTLAEILKGRGYATFGMTANSNINTVCNFHQGFDEYVDSHVVPTWMNPDSEIIRYRETRLASAVEVFESALRFARQHPSQPCYLQLNVMDVHEYWRGENKLTRPEFDKLFRDSETPEYLQALRQLSIDTAAFIEELRRVPGREDTLFVLISDHGEGLNSHPGLPNSRYHGRYLYESQVVVPWIMYHAGGGDHKGVSIKPTVQLLDFFPTVLDYLDFPVPVGVDGVSLMPLVEGSELALPDFYVTETYCKDAEKIAIYGEEWVYIENRDGYVALNPQELQKRGGGENGIITDAIDAHPEIAARLRASLAEWEARVPKSPSIPSKQELSDEEEAQLKAIGYLE